MIFFTINLLIYILIFNLTLFYLDNFKLSTHKIIRVSQILVPVLLVSLIIIFYCQSNFVFNEITWFYENKNISNTISIGTSFEVNRDAAEALGRNVGIGGTIAGVSGAVAKGIAKSSMPPLQKAGVIIGADIPSGAIFVGTYAVNRVVNGTNVSSKFISVADLSSNLNKFLPDSHNGISDLMVLLLSINALICVCLSLMVILSMMILFKFYLSENKIKLNLSKFLGDKINKNLNFYLIKLIQLNKKTSAIYIIIILIIILISLAFSCYFVTELYNNIDKFIDLHINYKK